jgi:arsenite oxidase small subunit
MGCALRKFNAQTGALTCGCHYSIFDLTKGGMTVMGQATDNLPQVELEYEETTGDIYAIGITGLLYGRQANVIAGV